MGKNIDMQAFSRLIQSTQEYIDSASLAKNTLLETLETCGQVMGNDTIYKKQKPKIEAALESLTIGITSASMMKLQLESKLRELINFEKELDS